MKFEKVINENKGLEKSNTSFEKSEGKYGEGEKVTQVLVTRNGKVFMRKQKVGRANSNTQISHEREVQQVNKDFAEQLVKDYILKNTPGAFRDISKVKPLSIEDVEGIVADAYDSTKMNSEEHGELVKLVSREAKDINRRIRSITVANDISSQLNRIDVDAIKKVQTDIGFTGTVRPRLILGDSMSNEVTLEFTQAKETKKFSLTGVSVSGYTRDLNREVDANELIIAGKIVNDYKKNTTSGVNGVLRNVENTLNEYASNPDYKNILNSWEE
jgi:hypothetical protein